ncbi:xylulokinase [Alteribacillus sp. HJP-4]|uniref:xylulokinase n=1 Tax=Alteribacillus sp. HJP-4 TaxID=2775394 RepID=UPI0035CD171D
MEYIIGIDLGTSGVKALLIDRNGRVADEAAESYPIYHDENGYSEQDPEDWVRQTKAVLSKIAHKDNLDKANIKGISFSGQMHGLVLLDKEKLPLRRAILWNDTRTSTETKDIAEAAGLERVWEITKNNPLEGFTLPKVLWVKKHEPATFEKADVFLLPKDYVRYRLTGHIGIDFSDAAGTLMLDLNNNEWSEEILETCGVPLDICPPVFPATKACGTLLNEVAEETGCPAETKVFAGGADNACGAVGAGILEQGKTMCSIGTSGVMLTYAGDQKRHFDGKLHFFNHAADNTYYAMGVTLAAGYSLQWFKDTFLKDKKFDEMIKSVTEVPAGSRGLLFTPYIAGERTPHSDAFARGSFIGMDASHTAADFVKAVMEGITFSLKESLDIIEENGMAVDTVIAIGGGAKSREWLQLQADIFGKEVISLKNEQGPAMGAAIIAAYGCGWFSSLQEAARAFVETGDGVKPIEENVEVYQKLFPLYKNVYQQTKDITEALSQFR